MAHVMKKMKHILPEGVMPRNWMSPSSAWKREDPEKIEADMAMCSRFHGEG